MRGKKRSALRWIVVLAVGLAGALLLACVIPILSPATPTPLPTPTIPPTLALPTPAQPAAPAVGTPGAEVTISEQEANRWLQGMQTHLGEGIDLSDTSVKIHSTGITVTGKAQVAQLQGALIPVEIVLQPVVRDRRLSLEVLDVRLGGAYSSFSGLVKPLISTGIAQGVDANALLAQRGLRVAAVELQEGYMVVNTTPAKPGE